MKPKPRGGRRGVSAAPRKGGRAVLRLAVSAEVGRRFAPYLRPRLRALHRLIGSRVSELSVALVSDRTMAALHQRDLGIAGPTDVLTYALESDAQGNVTAGEIVICVPEAARRAGRGKGLGPELLLYGLHGLLHLHGLDDRTDAGFAAMHRMEDELLSRLGIGPVFAPVPRKGRAGPRPRRGRRC